MRDAKDHLCMTIQTIDKDHSFALMFSKTSIRNVFADKLQVLVNRMQGDEFGEYPKFITGSIARHYAAFGIVLTLKEVKERASREEGNLISDDFIPASESESEASE